MLMEEKEKKEIEITILLAEYTARRDEILFLSQRYSRLVMSVVSLSSAIIVMGKFFLEMGTSSPAAAGGSTSTAATFVVLLVIAVPLLAYYLLASAMDTLHMIFLNGLRSEEIEKNINRLAKEKLLVWETHVIGNVFMKNPFMLRYFWIQPNLLQAVFLFGLLGIVFVLLTMLASHFMLPPWTYLYKMALWAGLIFLIQQWFALVMPVRMALAAQIQSGGHMTDSKKNKCRQP